MHLQLRKFDPSQIPKGSVVLCIGKRNSGKSWLCKDLLWHLRDIPAGIVVSATADATGWYRGWIPDVFVHDEYDKELVEKFIARQRALCKAGKPRDAFLVLDDVMYDKRFLSDKPVRALFLNGRHYKVTLLLCVQYAMDLQVSLRSNVDYVCCFREPILANRQRLYQNFFGMFPSFDVFCQVMDSCTENYECLVLNNATSSNNIEDCVSWYKAKPRSNFRVGNSMFWRFNDEHYDPHDGNDREDKNRRDARKNRVVVEKKSGRG